MPMLNRNLGFFSGVLQPIQSMAIRQAEIDLRSAGVGDAIARPLLDQAGDAYQSDYTIRYAYPMITNGILGVYYVLVPGLKFNSGGKHWIFITADEKTDRRNSYCHCSDCRLEMIRMVLKVGDTPKPVLDWLGYLPQPA